MPHTFIQVGGSWLNLDLVTRIEFVPDPAAPTRTFSVTVHFSSGKAHLFVDQVEVKILTDWVVAHKAP